MSPALRSFVIAIIARSGVRLVRYNPAVIVNLTVRRRGALVAALLASSVKLIGSAGAFTAEIPVTTSADAVPRVVGPALAAPAGAARETASDTPDGMASSSDAAIFWFDSLVMIA